MTPSSTTGRMWTDGRTEDDSIYHASIASRGKKSVKKGVV